MFGNTLGWLISILIVAATVLGLVWFEKNVSNVTEPTDFVRDPSNLALELPISPQSVLAASSPADAGEIYRQAIDMYVADQEPYDRFLAAGRRSGDAEGLAALDLLVSASTCGRMSLFSQQPHQIVRYGEKPHLEAIRALGKAANRLGALLHYENKSEEALTQHRAAFALGARLYEERLTLDELLAGLELMAEASAGIVAAHSDADAARPFAQFKAACASYHQTQIQPAQRVITSIDAQVIEQHSGDVFWIARHAAERMWRVEAILKLGRLRFNAARVSDQRAAERVLQRLGSDPDPVIRTTASAAAALTIEQYRMLQ